MKFSLIATISAMSIASANAGGTMVELANGVYSVNCHIYKYFGEGTRKWSGAETWTAAYAGEACGKEPHLATLTSEGENHFVADLIKDIPDPYAWIGGHDTQVEGTFVWVTGEDFSWTHWGTSPLQPDNAFGGEEDCIQFTTQLNEETGLYDYWNDLHCTNYQRPFIVEWDCDCPDPPTSPPGVSGDPHFKTWTGEMYDFHGICDLVLLTNPQFSSTGSKNLGMDIHVRTEQTKSWSYISAAAIRIGQDTLEVRGGNNGDAHYWVNGVEGAPLSSLSSFAVVYEQANSKQHTFTIAYNGENHETSKIVIKTFKNFVRVDMNGANAEDFEHSLGLMGTFDTGAKIGRDGVSVMEDVNAFGQEWQVLPQEPQLFHNLEGPQAPEQCRIPQQTSLRRRLAEIDITLEDAEIACSRVNPAEFDLCVFDVIATNDKELAGAY